MLRLKIVSVGKTKEEWLETALKEYLKRLQGNLQVEFLFFKDDQQLLKHLEKEAYYIALDPQGKLFTSEEFAGFLFVQFEKSHSRLTMVIGGAEGLPDSVKDKAPLISLSRMTFTHQCTRLILLEQIYRAFEIDKGTQYHK